MITKITSDKTARLWCGRNKANVRYLAFTQYELENEMGIALEADELEELALEGVTRHVEVKIGVFCTWGKNLVDAVNKMISFHPDFNKLAY